MKSTFFILLLSSSIVYGQSTKEIAPKESYETVLGTTLTAIKNDPNSNALIEGVNTLKRVNHLYPGEWLTDYYSAYFDLSIAMMAPPDESLKYMDEAKELINKLKVNPNALLSEVFTLEGMYYYYLIGLNPQENGQKYYKNVYEAYQRAIKIDNKNPRPSLMLAKFKVDMAKFMGQKTDGIGEELVGIENRFNAFVPLYPLYPTWGKSELMKLKQVLATKENNG